jgi:hypothetical protein
MEQKYQEYYEEHNTNFPTSIHTRINSQYRVSTIYRRASTIEPMFFWETIIWDGERVFEMESHNGIEHVLKYHYDKYLELSGL